MVVILPQGENHSIRPSDIPLLPHYFDSFGHYETEISAYYILKMCQKRGHWNPFTLTELEEVYQEAKHFDGFKFNRLIDPGVAYYSTGPRIEGGGWIVQGEDLYYITIDFVHRLAISAANHEELNDG